MLLLFDLVSLVPDVAVICVVVVDAVIFDVVDDDVVVVDDVAIFEVVDYDDVVFVVDDVVVVVESETRHKLTWLHTRTNVLTEKVHREVGRESERVRN